MNSNESEACFAELISFVRDISGEHEIPISRTTSLENDLGITGLDAERLIIEFGKKFKIEISNFSFRTYFNDEPSIFETSREVKSFTLAHLEKALLAGRLDEEVINGS